MKHLFSADGLFRRSGDRYSVEQFDPETYDAVIRCSICTGEKVAGFKHKRTGKFTDVMLIRSSKDEQEFKRTYHVDTVRTEY